MPNDHWRQKTAIICQVYALGSDFQGQKLPLKKSAFLKKVKDLLHTQKNENHRDF